MPLITQIKIKMYKLKQKGSQDTYDEDLTYWY